MIQKRSPLNTNAIRDLHFLTYGNLRYLRNELIPNVGKNLEVAADSEKGIKEYNETKKFPTERLNPRIQRRRNES